MALVWLALALALAAVAATTTVAVIRALDLFRTFRTVGAGMSRELGEIERQTAQIEGNLAAAARSGDALDSSLARLRASRAELNVLLSALQDTRASVSRLTAFWPAK